MLIAVSACLSRVAVGPAGLVARYGGEEFALLLTDVEVDEAVRMAEIVRRKVYDLAQPHPGSTMARLTVSVGVAVITPDGATTSADLLRAADLALYQAKHAGRNRVMPAPLGALAA